MQARTASVISPCKAALGVFVVEEEGEPAPARAAGDWSDRYKRAMPRAEEWYAEYRKERDAEEGER